MNELWVILLLGALVFGPLASGVVWWMCVPTGSDPVLIALALVAGVLFVIAFAVEVYTDLVKARLMLDELRERRHRRRREGRAARAERKEPEDANGANHSN